MDNFPSNAHHKKDVMAVRPETAKPKPERVVQGEVILKKKGIGRRFKETFMGDSTQGVADFIFMDVLVPAFKDMVADAMSQGVERMLFGEARSTSRRPGGFRPEPRGNSHINYGAFGKSTSSRVPVHTSRDRDEHHSMSRRARASHDFGEIILPTRVDAEEVLSRMYELLKKFEMVSVSELYDMLGITSNYTDEKWGWIDLQGSGVIRRTRGYELVLPRPEEL